MPDLTSRLTPEELAFIELAIPKIAAWLRDLWRQHHPNTPPLTEEQILAMWPIIRDASIAKDDAFRAEEG